MREAKDDAPPVDDEAEAEHCHAGYPRQASELFAEDAKERVVCAAMLEVRCDAVGEHYPDHFLKNRAAPVSSLRADARHRHRESVARPGRAVRRSASSARPRGRRTIASHAGETRTDALNTAMPMFDLVIKYAPHVNASPMDVGAPAPRDETSARARTRSRFRGTAPTAPAAPTRRTPAGPLARPHRADLARLRSVPAARRRQLRLLRRARGPVRRPLHAARRHVRERLRRRRPQRLPISLRRGGLRDDTLPRRHVRGRRLLRATLPGLRGRVQPALPPHRAPHGRRVQGAAEVPHGGRPRRLRRVRTPRHGPPRARGPRARGPVPFFFNFPPEPRAAPQATRRRSRSCRSYCRGPGPPRRRPSSRT